MAYGRLEELGDDRKLERLVARHGGRVEMDPGSRMSRDFTVIRGAGLVMAIWLMGLVGAVHACLICIPYPEKRRPMF
jgi:hypothetical protein